MCCTLEPAELSKTILYAGETKVGDDVVHVLGYQNRAKNLSEHPNAMILPFPAAEPMTKENVLDISGFKTFMQSYDTIVRMFEPRPRGRGLLLGSSNKLNSRGFDVFDSGMYTVVLADNALKVSDAMHLVPEKKRPQFHYGIFGKYAKWYPNWPIAICCFDGSVEPEPMLWWYKPKSLENLFMPALDAHDGHAPRIGALVEVDHTVVFGSTIKPFGAKARLENVPVHLEPFLARQVVGSTLQCKMPNGDFHMAVDALKEQWVRPRRLPPPGA